MCPRVVFLGEQVYYSKQASCCPFGYLLALSQLLSFLQKSRFLQDSPTPF